MKLFATRGVFSFFRCWPTSMHGTYSFNRPPALAGAKKPTQYLSARSNVFVCGQRSMRISHPQTQRRPRQTKELGTMAFTRVQNGSMAGRHSRCVLFVQPSTSNSTSKSTPQTYCLIFARKRFRMPRRESVSVTFLYCTVAQFRTWMYSTIVLVLFQRSNVSRCCSLLVRRLMLVMCVMGLRCWLVVVVWCSLRRTKFFNIAA